MIDPAAALALAQRSLEFAATPPLVAVDLRRLGRTFRRNESDRELTRLLNDVPWVAVGVVDDDLDPVFAPLADAFDVLIGVDTTSDAAVDVAGDHLDETISELDEAAVASPDAALALVQLLRISHRASVRQALFAESLTYAMLQSGEVFRQWLAERPSRPEPGPAAAPAVTIERTGSLVTITLSRPDKRNALNIAMRDQLFEALELVAIDTSIDGAVLRGAGANFCAGGDLDEFGSTPSAATGHRVRMQRSLGAQLDRVADRVRVHVHGTCVGAGIELPAFAHSIVAHPAATFRLPEIGFGLVPGAGGTVSITRRCGRHRTAWLALSGRPIDAQQALHWRLIDRIDTTDAPDATAPRPTS